MVYIFSAPLAHTFLHLELFRPVLLLCASQAAPRASKKYIKHGRSCGVYVGQVWVAGADASGQEGPKGHQMQKQMQNTVILSSARAHFFTFFQNFRTCFSTKTGTFNGFRAFWCLLADSSHLGGHFALTNVPVRSIYDRFMAKIRREYKKFTLFFTLRERG